MIAIFDRKAKRLPIETLLRIVVKKSLLEVDEPVVLTRLGGVGEVIWGLESRLDAGESVITSIGELQCIVSTPGQIIDELRCGNQRICIGVSDATFMFVQSVDKNIEKEIASQFRQATVIADQG